MPIIPVNIPADQLQRLRRSGEVDDEAVARVILEQSTRAALQEVQDWWDSLSPLEKRAIFEANRP